MGKQRRVQVGRSPKKRVKPARVSSTSAVSRPAERQAEPAPPPPSRKPAFYEALARYELGVRALQRHDFAVAADSFRHVVQQYPDERELVERARLYLQVCERETARRPAGPQTPAERVYAATVALNSGDSDTALAHLTKALEQDSDSDHAHYIMAVALVERSDFDSALNHLRSAIELNPDNRSLATQDPDLGPLRELDAFRDVVGSQVSPSRRRTRARR
jgi:Tfp pilus assembly protein PilF